ncbi:hypothetical protein [Acinetobacter sp. ANC 4648]|uniref:hypothetical protein n=1 Tax=Acinetobacter sp. ANC 4648 TaxID=1977875 RepID=UPI000A33703A|nr:hypothetical protein [Acinetobacter sp. ANC 4648]OTG85141.1 hypothetical protein B9T27_02740 [Acinetobacter sp. ANC 4648]
MLKLPFTTLLICSVVTICGCQTISKTSTQVKDLIRVGEQKAPQIDQQDVIDVSKTTLEKIEQMTLNMPTGQWIYIENDLQGIYTLQNKSIDGNMLLLRLNCKITSQQSGFILRNKDGQDILKAHDEQAGQIQFLLDNKNYGNPFHLSNSKKIDAFKTALQKTKVIKIFNASKLYTFQNAHAERLEQAVSCKD